MLITADLLKRGDFTNECRQGTSPQHCKDKNMIVLGRSLLCLHKILPPKRHNRILSLLEYEQSCKQMFPRKAITNIGYCLMKLCRQSSP